MDRVISAILKLPGVSRIAETTLGHYVTIFMLHRSQAETPSLLGANPDVLEQCLQYAQNNNFQFLSIDDILELATNGETPSRPTICFTLDDGFLDQTETLIPILLKYNAKPTLFVLESFVNQLAWPWDAKVGYLLANAKPTVADFSFESSVFNLDTSSTEAAIKTRRHIVSHLKRCNPSQTSQLINDLAMRLDIGIPQKAPSHFNAPDWDKLRMLEKQGLRIGSHASSHHPFTSLSDEQIREELTRSLKTLKHELRNPSSVFCYPSGTQHDFNAGHTKLVQAAGYAGAVTAISGNTTLLKIANAPYTIPRHSFPTSLVKFIRYTSWVEFVRSKIS
ncbi:polysaccharide deacetylase family protein [Simiduia curdlanivorans]|uniref:Polysaccharide deacetylase family protein n=1 Tax=Simiduia curdlanivorans TaxID=1492769 RepID=A0ABV8V962_9GAMM|nr:polysaccharide deacetylase family protein [Simiduia curdlanivorans]MDN3638497.1 polysaccharide deacetylase family protein [Simiduia curdlanivorans]